MVYVGKSKEAVPDESTATDEMSDGMKLPPEYRGTRFDKNGEMRSYEEDGEALRHAEELFRRGYVFEEAAGAETAPEPETNKGEAVEANATPAATRTKSRPSPRKEGPPSVRGALSGLLGSISTEEILIGAIILMLLLNGADDELLIMLVILLFC